MTLLRPQDAYHKAQLVRLLIAILDEPTLAENLRFKGGTCASMLGFLDRFSVDLDFDVRPEADKSVMRRQFYKIFVELGLEVKDESKKVLEFFLRYQAAANARNTIKLDALSQGYVANEYRPQRLAEIDRIAVCQTIETMFANKLVAPVDRFERNGTVAGRDIYDIHYFYMTGRKYVGGVIGERTGMAVGQYLRKLKKFIEEQMTETVINQDLNALLPAERFQAIRKSLKTETLLFLDNDLGRLRNDKDGRVGK